MNYFLADFLISGEWITGLIVAIIGAVGAVWLRMRGAEKTQREQVKLSEPVPEVPVRKVYSPPTYWQHKALEDRVSQLAMEQRALSLEQHALRDALAKQFVEILEAGHQREARLADKLEGVARGIHARIDKMLGTGGNSHG